MNTRTHAARIANARIAKARARAHEAFIGGRRGCRYACCAGAARRQRAVRSASTPGASQAHAQAPSTAPHSTAVCTHRHVHPERVRGKFIYSRRAEGGARYLSGSGSGSRSQWSVRPGPTCPRCHCQPMPHLRGARVRLPVACAVHGAVAPLARPRSGTGSPHVRLRLAHAGSPCPMRMPHGHAGRLASRRPAPPSASPLRSLRS